jgi:para-aminobenzoate synthetase component 1
MALLTEIPYRPDSEALFDRLSCQPWAVFLDSGHPLGGGRYDILAAHPYQTLTTRGGVTEIRAEGRSRWSPQDPFALLREALGEVAEEVAGLPFCGGALGWFSYDLGRRLERLPARAKDLEKLPEMAIGLYDWALLVDHQQRRAVLLGQGRCRHTRRHWRRLVRYFERPAPRRRRDPFRVTGAVRANLSQADYAKAFARIQRYIDAGDCYQVNFAQRFAASASGDAWPAYRQLRQLNPAPFAAFLNTPYGQVLSSSPERLLQLRGGYVQSQPIKGTRPRGETPEQDAALARALLGSAKDRAENLMIVDLLRNDIGRVCQPGSVRVPTLFAVESYATVHHLVSTVSGQLSSGGDAAGLLRACFPGGSITGAPKIRAMQIIEELEPQRRGVYCGAIGYIGFDGAMDVNIAIRTLVYNQGEIRCWAGGGIVHDSELRAEYGEIEHKAAAMLRLIEQARLPSVVA